jgi:TRAP transporter 4TM/12TM fusion protein
LGLHSIKVGWLGGKIMTKKLLEEIDDKNLLRLPLILKYAVTLIAAIFSLYHIYVLGFVAVNAWILYNIHLGTAILLIIVMYPIRKKNEIIVEKILNMALALLIIYASTYYIVQMDELIQTLTTSPTSLDLVAASILVILVLETTRRTSGIILPLIAIIFILYAKFGYLFPGIWGHRGYSWNRIISFLTGFDAIFSSPISATANFVFLFIIFASFLNTSGAGEFFINIAIALTGSKRGGPAKAAVFASALFGTLSGTSVTNVVTTGTFTIPLMKKVGYANRFAGAVEATASTGGQIMPPVLGAAAFIMAQLTGIPYNTIAVASILPAVLYFLAVYVMVDLESAKLGLKGLPKKELTNPIHILKEKGYLFIPLVVLIFALIILNESPNKSALWAMLSIVIILAITRIELLNLKKIIASLSSAAFSAIGIIAACATAGIIIGVINLTGVGLRFSSYLILLSGGNLFISLMLTMTACIILGMGLPTAASYIIPAVIMAPALIELGVSQLAAHMFVFYFACLSAITPPVALAAYAGAALAKAKPLETAFTAVKLGIIAFIVPFMFVYGEALLLQGGMIEVFWVIITSIIGTIVFAFAVQGWAFNKRLGIVIRIVLGCGALLLIKPGLYTDIIGIILIGVIGFGFKMQQKFNK